MRRPLHLSLPTRLRQAGELVSVALYLLLVAAGLYGVQGDVADNILPTAVWVLWWVGVYALAPGASGWVEKARMPTKRSAGVAVVHQGRIYVAGGGPPRGQDFAVYDPAADGWTTLPDLPSQRNHIGAAFVDGLIRVVGGGDRVGGSNGTLLNQVYRPDMRCE